MASETFDTTGLKQALPVMLGGSEALDVVIVGGGFCGIHCLYTLRKKGLKVKIIERADDFGGTWYWNKYPGARVDSDIPLYELSLENIWRDWTWGERFPGWKELQNYFAFLDKRLELRKDSILSHEVKKAHWDGGKKLWIVQAVPVAGGQPYNATAKHVIFATGFASKAWSPDIKGMDTFKGIMSHTARWPKGGIDTKGKRVAVIGTGASGIQVIQEVASEVSDLVVFQRTPNLALPMVQYKIDARTHAHFRPVYRDMLAKRPHTFGGLYFGFKETPTPQDDEAREAQYERLWATGGLAFWLGGYIDLISDQRANDQAYAFWQKKVAARITDPKKRELLAPKKPPHPFGTKRPSLEQTFYEEINRENVHFVDVNENPITEITSNGVKTQDGTIYEVDVIVLATGFDTHTATLTNIDVQGENGLNFQEKWKDGVETYLGMTVAGFPNFYTLYGAHGPTAFCNGPTCAEVQGGWACEAIDYVNKNGGGVFRVDPVAEAEWKKHIVALCDATLLTNVRSWYMGTNIPGKRKEPLNYLGGVPAYVAEIKDCVDKGYQGFTLSAS